MQVQEHLRVSWWGFLHALGHSIQHWNSSDRVVVHALNVSCLRIPGLAGRYVFKKRTDPVAACCTNLVPQVSFSQTDVAVTGSERNCCAWALVAGTKQNGSFASLTAAGCRCWSNPAAALFVLLFVRRSCHGILGRGCCCGRPEKAREGLQIAPSLSFNEITVICAK